MPKIYTTETIIEQFKKKNKHNFDYSKVEYQNMLTEVCIICPTHGEIQLKPIQILRNCLCPKCREEKLTQLRTTKEQFIEKAKEIHKDSYIYAKVNYKGVNDKVCIICKEHGEFWVTPHCHLQGSRCPQCGLNIRVKKSTHTLETFNEREKLVHGDKYDTSKVEYVNNNTKVCLICHQKDKDGAEHGEFWQTPYKHLNLKQGCPKCSKTKKSNTEEFIEKGQKLNNDRLIGFSNVKYKNNSTKVCLICHYKEENGVEHGEFWITPHNFLLGRGCPKCKNRKISESETKTNEQYIKEIEEVHGGKYDTSKVEYKGANSKVCLICPIHGEFWQKASSHLSGCGCPKCGKQISKAEEDIKQFIRDNFDIEILSNKRDILSGSKELDIYIPSMKIAFEYNGMIWHSEKFGKDKDYHLNKTLNCLEKGIKLYHIYEYEWLNKQDAVKNNILQIIKNAGNYSEHYESNSKIVLIDKGKAEEFLDEYDIQGFIVSDLYIGAILNDKLVGVMSVSQCKGDVCNITRLCTIAEGCFIGIENELFNWFIGMYNPSIVNIITDRRWTNGERFEKLGFELIETLPPTFAYTRSPNEYLTALKTEREGFYKIWNCGYLRYQWESNNFS